jgi:hypothetical protein
MAGKPKKEKAPKKSLIEFNSGYKPRELKVGQVVDVFKIPYKAKAKSYSGRVKKIIYKGAFSACCLLERLDTGSETIDFIYLGKIYDGWDKPFS